MNVRDTRLPSASQNRKRFTSSEISIRLQRIVHWWLAEAQKVIPSRLQKLLSVGEISQLVLVRFAAPQGALLQVLDGAEKVIVSRQIAVAQHTHGAVQQFVTQAGFTGRPARIALAVPPRTVFWRSIDIPKEATKHLADTLREELTRRTPFQPEQVFTNAIISAHPTSSSKVSVHQSIIRRDLVEEHCNAVGLTIADIDQIAVFDSSNVVARIPIGGRGKAKREHRHFAIPILAAAFLSLLVVNLTASWWRYSAAIHDMEARIPIAREQAMAVRKLLDDASRRQGTVHSLNNRKREPNILLVWEAIARSLPDTTWLTEFTLHSGRLTIAGYSENAASLVPPLAASKFLSNVALSSPTVLQRGSGIVERFTIDAKVNGDWSD